MLTRLPSWSVRANSGAWMPPGIEPPRNGECAVCTTCGLSDWPSIREIATTPMIANNAHVVAKSARARRDDTDPRVPLWYGALGVLAVAAASGLDATR